MGAVSSDTEYFCPMDPGVLSSWPGKCSVCQMSLVRRSKGDMGPRPDGVIARVQFSPDRLLLGGIQSAIISYQPLSHTIQALGVVHQEQASLTVHAEVRSVFTSMIHLGQWAELSSSLDEMSWNHQTKILSIESNTQGDSLRISFDVDERDRIYLNQIVKIQINTLMSDIAPFNLQLQGSPRIVAGDQRFYYGCEEHESSNQLSPGICFQDKKKLIRHDLQKNQTLGWACLTHPSSTFCKSDSQCLECGSLSSHLQILSYRPMGMVLSVPESAVIDTGNKKIVYVEKSRGLFDAVEVHLGFRCDSYFPVLEGLVEGQRVVSMGAFLVDAETRLNPSLRLNYFGSKRSDLSSDISRLTQADLLVIQRQQTCPVTGKSLGSMGTPVRVVNNGKTIFLCCEGCLHKLTNSVTAP